MEIAGRVSVPLDTGELQALTMMAKDGVRHPRDQLRYLLREEARRRGLLEACEQQERELDHGANVEP
jgi:hypothetical protein